MKRILSVLLALTMLLSLSSVGFANAYINYTYMDEVTGFTYHFGRFDEGATDAGLVVNGIKRSLTGGKYEGEYANAFAQADANSNLFGIGIKPASTYEGTTYTAAPYATVNGVDVVGQEVTYSTEEYTNLLKDVVLNDVVVADVVNGKDVETNSQYTEITTYGTSGTSLNNLQSKLIKLDLTKIPASVKNIKNNNYVLTMKAKYANWSQKINDGTDDDVAAVKARLSDPTVLVFDASAAGDWTEEDPYKIIHTDGNPRFYYTDYFGVNSPNPVLIDKVTFPKSATSFIEFSVNITSQVKKALENNETYTSILLGLDTTEAIEITNEGKVKVREILSIQPNEIEAYKISCMDVAETPVISSVKVDGVNIDLADFNNKEYTVNLPNSVAIPEVTATASNEYGVISVTQATAENPVAIVSLSVNGRVQDTLKINFNIVDVVNDITFLSTRDSGVKVAHAGVGIWNTSDRPLSTTGNSFAICKKDVTSTVSNNYKVCNAIALMQLDLSKFVGIDTSKPVFMRFNTTGLSSATNPTISYDAKNDSAIVSIYDASSAFPGGITSVQATDIHYVTDETNTSKIDAIVTDANRVASAKITATATESFIDVSEYINEAIKAGKTSCLIAFAVDSYEGNAESTYQAASVTFNWQSYFSNGFVYYK